MRFLLVIRNIGRGIYKGIRKEVQVLTKIASLNDWIKIRNHEVKNLYLELGEYVYVMKDCLDGEHVDKLYRALDVLHEEIEQYQRELDKLKDG